LALAGALAVCSPAFSAPHKGAPGVALGLRVASGTPQSVFAFAASSAPGYETAFPTPLVVRMSGGTTSQKSLRFFCADAGCRFALSEQPDAVKRVDARTYEVPVEAGAATLSVTLSTDAPGTFTVIARPMHGRLARGGADARFRLTAR